MGWLRYRKKSSASIGSWVYEFHDHEFDAADMRSRVNELSENYSWSEHHRGYDIEKVKDEDVPFDVVCREIRYAGQRAHFAETERQAMLRRLLAVQIKTFDKVG